GKAAAEARREENGDGADRPSSRIDALPPPWPGRPVANTRRCRMGPARVRFLTALAAGGLLPLAAAQAAGTVQYVGYVDAEGRVVKDGEPKKDPPRATENIRTAAVESSDAASSPASEMVLSGWITPKIF